MFFIWKALSYLKKYEALVLACNEALSMMTSSTSEKTSGMLFKHLTLSMYTDINLFMSCRFFT